LGTTYTQTAPNAMSLNLEPTVILQSNKVQGGILQELFVANAGNFTAIQYQNPDPILTRKKIVQKTAFFWDFFITDEDHVLINSLNGQNITFSLMFMKIVDNINLSRQIRALIVSVNQLLLYLKNEEDKKRQEEKKRKRIEEETVAAEALQKLSVEPSI